MQRERGTAVTDLAEEFLGVSAAKVDLPSRLSALESGRAERVVLLKNNNPVAVIVTVEEYNSIREAREFIEDTLAVLAARSADDGTRVGLDDLRAEFGLDDD